MNERLREIEEICNIVESEGDAILDTDAGWTWAKTFDALTDAIAIARELDADLQEAVKLCHEARQAISQGRIAAEDEQDMTAWHVQTGPLQARLEQMVARHKEADNG